MEWSDPFGWWSWQSRQWASQPCPVSVVATIWLARDGWRPNSQRRLAPALEADAGSDARAEDGADIELSSSGIPNSPICTGKPKGTGCAQRGAARARHYSVQEGGNDGGNTIIGEGVGAMGLLHTP